MKKIEKAKDWAVTLAAMREELATFPPDQDATGLKAKIANLERAMAIRSSLSPMKPLREKWSSASSLLPCPYGAAHPYSDRSRSLPAPSPWPTSSAI